MNCFHSFFAVIGRHCTVIPTLETVYCVAPSTRLIILKDQEAVCSRSFKLSIKCTPWTPGWVTELLILISIFEEFAISSIAGCLQAEAPRAALPLLSRSSNKIYFNLKMGCNEKLCIIILIFKLFIQGFTWLIGHGRVETWVTAIVSLKNRVWTQDSLPGPWSECEGTVTPRLDIQLPTLSCWWHLYSPSACPLNRYQRDRLWSRGVSHSGPTSCCRL